MPSIQNQALGLFYVSAITAQLVNPFASPSQIVCNILFPFDMFNILLGWRKASKCKNLVRLVQCRLRVLKIKRDTIIRELRDDIAHLLDNGQIDTAFSRVEQLFKDQSLLAAYDLLDHFCEFIIIHFPYIRKHKNCPDDINEAVSSLVFAAAWCGDLPELKSIQKLFAERYGHKFAKAADGLYPGNLVNNQIREKLIVKSIPDNAKVRLIDEIAKEYSLLNLRKNDRQWEEFVFKEVPEVNYNSLKGQQILASCNEDKLADRPVNSIFETFHPEMKLYTFSWEDSFGFHDNTVSFEGVQEFRFSTVQDERDEDKRAFLFFDSCISPLGDCSKFGGASYLFLSNYDYGGQEIDRPGSCHEAGCLRKSDLKSNGKRFKRIDSKESQFYQSCFSPVLKVNCIECGQRFEEFFFGFSENEKSICHHCGLPSSSCIVKHRKSYCRGRFSEDIEFNCSLEHPCNYSVMEFHGENLIKERRLEAEVSDFPASCTSWCCCSCSKGSNARTVTTENNLQSASSEFQRSEKSSSWHSHVHPKLPDYDEVAAKFMALKREHQQRTAA